MILIDAPHWPAHGTTFAHLASDGSLAELHSFAADHGLPWQAFDHDHYDVRADRVESLIAAGALPVSGRELVARLRTAGLRVGSLDRVPKRRRALAALTRSWQSLMPQAPELGQRLLRRWTQSHRAYHDVGHLFQMLGALEVLHQRSVPKQAALAAWFHDAVYDGVPGQDEARSAQLARAELSAVGEPSDLVTETSRLVLLTATHRTEATDAVGTTVIDADLSILGQPPGRYQMYVRAVRREHPTLSDAAFGLARLDVLRALLSAQTLYGSKLAQRLWLNQARHNLFTEVTHWQDVVGHGIHDEPSIR